MNKSSAKRNLDVQRRLNKSVQATALLDAHRPKSKKRSYSC